MQLKLTRKQTNTSTRFSVGFNIFISNQSFDMHMIFTYNDTLIRLEWKQQFFSVVSYFLDFGHEYFREQIRSSVTLLKRERQRERERFPPYWIIFTAQ